MDKKIIFALIDKFSESAMSSLDYSDGEVTLALRKNADAPQPEHRPPVAVRAALPPEAPPPAAPTHPADTGDYITSPIVGGFYGSSGPDAPPFVEPGSFVKAGQILCVIEAMKMMNKLEAEFDCEIVSVKATNGEMVEYGQPLFEVKQIK
jgi:acetyl-CoA carboxylase biotin carboxyl carrier protein